MVESAAAGSFDKRLLPFATLIGELCIEWTYLEGWIERVFMSVGEWDFTGHAALNMAHLLDKRDMMAAIRVGIASRSSHPALCSAVIESMDYIDNHLRPARNRCVHDTWVLAENLTDALRFELKPKVQKIRGQNEFFVQAGTMTPISTVEIREIISDVVREAAYIRDILPLTTWNPMMFQRRGAQLPAPPPRPYLLRQQETQRQRDKILAEQKRQPKSSRK